MKKTDMKMIDGPVRVDGKTYIGRAFGITVGAINAIVCADTDEELLWVWNKIFPTEKLDLEGISNVVVGQREKMTNIRKENRDDAQIF
jgi:hypothetical protein